MSDHEASADHRNRTIKGAVFTSILSKFGTLLLRMISIPLAVNKLGMEEFGVYATILVLVQMMDLFHVGIGPALTQKLSKAVLDNNKQKEAKLFSTSIIISASFTLAIATALFFVVLNVPVVDLFGAKYAPFAESMKRACIIAIILITVEMICLVAERARDGYMETRYTNMWGAGANLLGAIFLVIGIWKFPTIEFLILAVNGTIIAGKLGNTIQMMIQRPYLIPRPSTFDPGMVKMLMRGALVFTVVYGLWGVSEYNGLTYLVGRFLGPEQTGNFSIMVTLHISLSGIITMVTIPMWPALIDAHVRGDHDWIRSAAKRLRMIALAFGASVVGGMVLFGPIAMRIWVGHEFDLGRGTLILFGLYFMLHLWRNVNQILCLGLSREKTVSYVCLIEVTCYLTATVVLLNAGFGIPQIYAALCISLALCTGWMYPFIFHRAFRAPQTTPLPDPELSSAHK